MWVVEQVGAAGVAGAVVAVLGLPLAAQVAPLGNQLVIKQRVLLELVAAATNPVMVVQVAPTQVAHQVALVGQASSRAAAVAAVAVLVPLLFYGKGEKNAGSYFPKRNVPIRCFVGVRCFYEKVESRL
jgi:hypothetical protein